MPVLVCGREKGVMGGGRGELIEDILEWVRCRVKEESGKRARSRSGSVFKAIANAGAMVNGRER